MIIEAVPQAFTMSYFSEDFNTLKTPFVILDTEDILNVLKITYLPKEKNKNNGSIISTEGDVYRINLHLKKTETLSLKCFDYEIAKSILCSIDRSKNVNHSTLMALFPEVLV